MESDSGEWKGTSRKTKRTNRQSRLNRQGGGLPGCADYAACKAAVIELTETLAMENAKRGITVNSVSHGMILKSVGPHDGTWVGWSGSPDDIARAILFLASDIAAYMTGVDMPVGST